MMKLFLSSFFSQFGHGTYTQTYTFATAIQLQPPSQIEKGSTCVTSGHVTMHTLRSTYKNTVVYYCSNRTTFAAHPINEKGVKLSKNFHIFAYGKQTDERI